MRSSPYGHPQGFSTTNAVQVTIGRGDTIEVDLYEDANRSLAAGGTTTVDSVVATEGKLILCPAQSTGTQDGLYYADAVSGATCTMVRVPGFQAGDILNPGTVFRVRSGTVYGGRRLVVQGSAPIVLGTDAFTVELEPDASALASTTAGQGSALMGDSDAGTFYAGTTQAAINQEFGQHLRSVQHQIDVPIATAILAAGTPMAAFADNASSNPGITLVDSESVALRWNNNGTQTAVWLRANMPQDLDDAANVVMHILASKTGATSGDATSFTVTAFFQTVGALHDADADCGGTSSAMTGNATAKTVAELTLTLALADVPASPSALSFSIKPTDGTLGTDDVCVHAIWFEYKGAILTA